MAFPIETGAGVGIECSHRSWSSETNVPELYHGDRPEYYLIVLNNVQAYLGHHDTNPLHELVS